MRASLLLLALSAIALPLRAQPHGVLQLDGDLDRFLVRQHVAGHLPDAILTHRPLSAYQARAYLDTLALDPENLSRADRVLLARFRGDAPGPGADWARRRLGVLYPNGQDLFAVEGDGYAIQVNPLLYLAYGQARQTARGDRETRVPVWQNTRGVRGSGNVGPVFFEARIEENQRRDVQNPFDARKLTAPRLGNVQDYEGVGLDYYRATGLIGFHSRFFEIRAGRDRNRWGPGRTGLLVSDYAAPYDHLQIRTSVWRVEYVNLFTQFTNVQPQPRGSEPYPRRFGAFHHLTLRLPAGVDVSAYEGIVFTDTSSAPRRDGFDVAYLNPILFYRSAEQDRNSPDNAFLGFSAGWNVVKGARLYGDFVFDEFVAAKIGKDSWVNKWGWTVGAQVADVVVPGLSLRAEHTRLRPYLYAHRTPASALLHYDDGLGHPAGPNALDWSFFADYQPTPRLSAQVNVGYTRRGRNTPAANYGSDPRLSYDSRVASDGVTFLQGVRQTEWLVEATVGYELLPGLYAAAALRARSRDDAETGLDRSFAPYALVRWGLPYQSTQW